MLEAIAAGLGTNAVVKHYTNLSRGQLAVALGEVCYFPSELMRGPIEPTARLLNELSRGKVRMVRTFGCYEMRQNASFEIPRWPSMRNRIRISGHDKSTGPPASIFRVCQHDGTLGHSWGPRGQTI